VKENETDGPAVTGPVDKESAMFGPGFRPRLVAVPADRLATRLADFAEAGIVVGDGEVAAFLASVADVSPFLRDLMLREPDRLARLLAADAETTLDTAVATARDVWREGNRASVMSTLRKLRYEIALLIGLADLGGLWDVGQVTAALTAFADAATGAAARFALREASERGTFAPADPAAPDLESGWIVLGMGKFGAGELNYSSDIDLIVLFDPDVERVTSDRGAAHVYIGLTRTLTQVLGEHTADGYVFRTDLRLRPDPGATQIAISLPAALQYYESFGQNWERSAMIKARAVAGDLEAGEAFLAELRPYVWRRYLDFAAIADIHAIKLQIHNHKGFARVAVAGHNLKLGRGGIREIEFFVQTQQLIAGGRHPELRGRATLVMLDQLADGGWIDGSVRDDMADAYRFLRMAEHCLQIVADRQTHVLPEDDEALTVIARMAGFADIDGFATRLRATLETVRSHYGALFETERSLAGDLGNLVFTGDGDDPDTLETLGNLGFQRPSEVIAAVRGWHYGRYPATRSSSSRQRLNEFVPLLLASLAGSENADAAFVAFDRFLGRMPAGVQLFALLQSNRGLLGLLSLMLSAAPRLADSVVRRAHVLDALTEPAFFGGLPERDELERSIASSLAQAGTYEDVLDRARIFNAEQSLLIGARVLAGTAPVHRLGIAYSDLAEVVLEAVLGYARREFEANHGVIAGGRVALLALGRLGGREMTAASDLDLILLYDYPDRLAESDGPRKLDGTRYFARLTQRLVAAISAPTAEGVISEVDFRLRPSGKSGPLATHIEAFRSYQQNDAWTWEHMALTRARPIAGDDDLMRRAAAEIDAAVLKPRDRDKTLADIVDMRRRIEDAKGEGSAWDLKQAQGGLIDVQFIAQTLQLLHVGEHPELRQSGTRETLQAAAEAGLLDQGDAELLLHAFNLYQALMQVLRLCVDGTVKPESLTTALRDRLARASELPDFATLEAHLADLQGRVRAAFVRLLGDPGALDGGQAT